MQVNTIEVAKNDENMREGIDLPILPNGTRLKVGDIVLLEERQISKVCHDRCNIFYTVGDCVIARERIFVKVLVGGNVAVGDKIDFVP